MAGYKITANLSNIFHFEFSIAWFPQILLQIDSYFEICERCKNSDIKSKGFQVIINRVHIEACQAHPALAVRGTI